MFDRIKTLMTRWQDAKEIDALSERDLDDLGMTRDQVLAFSRMPADIADQRDIMLDTLAQTIGAVASVDDNGQVNVARLHADKQIRGGHGRRHEENVAVQARLLDGDGQFGCGDRQTGRR